MTRTWKDLLLSTAGLHEQKKAQNYLNSFTACWHSCLILLCQSRTLRFSPLGPGRLVWSSPVWGWAGWHRRGRQRGRRGCRGAEGSPPSTSQTSQSTRVRMAQRHVWAHLCPHRRPAHSPATAERRAPQRGTWDTLVECWAPALTGGPSCDNHAHGRTPSRPKAACPPEMTGPGCVACWGRRGYWDLRGTEVGPHWSPVWEPPGAFGWECERGLLQYATAKWHHIDPPGSRPEVYCFRSPPGEGHVAETHYHNQILFVIKTSAHIQVIFLLYIYILFQVTDQFAWGLCWTGFSQRVNIPTNRDLSPYARLRLFCEPPLGVHYKYTIGC